MRFLKIVAWLEIQQGLLEKVLHGEENFQYFMTKMKIFKILIIYKSFTIFRDDHILSDFWHIESALFDYLAEMKD